MPTNILQLSAIIFCSMLLGIGYGLIVLNLLHYKIQTGKGGDNSKQKD